MARLSPILRSLRESGGRRLAFWCPGCDEMHAVRVREEGSQRPSWEWNGLVLKPTFQPSILVTWTGPHNQKQVCHSYVTAGRIDFLPDSTHPLAGQTVDLPAWDEPYGGTED